MVIRDRVIVGDMPEIMCSHAPVMQSVQQINQYIERQLMLAPSGMVESNVHAPLEVTKVLPSYVGLPP